jgi:hypothetical protein
MISDDRQFILYRAYWKLLLVVPSAYFAFIQIKSEAYASLSVIEIALLYITISAIVISSIYYLATPVAKVKQEKLLIYNRLLRSPVEIEIPAISLINVYKRGGYPILFEICVPAASEQYQADDQIFGFNAIKFYSFLKNNLSFIEFFEQEYIEKENNTYFGKLFRKAIPENVLILSATVMLVILVVIGYMSAP